MPIISMFYGIIVRMYHFDNDRHKSPHFHVQYGAGVRHYNLYNQFRSLAEARNSIILIFA